MAGGILVPPPGVPPTPALKASECSHWTPGNSLCSLKSQKLIASSVRGNHTSFPRRGTVPWGPSFQAGAVNSLPPGLLPQGDAGLSRAPRKEPEVSTPGLTFSGNRLERTAEETLEGTTEPCAPGPRRSSDLGALPVGVQESPVKAWVFCREEVVCCRVGGLTAAARAWIFGYPHVVWCPKEQEGTQPRAHQQKVGLKIY